MNAFVSQTVAVRPDRLGGLRELALPVLFAAVVLFVSATMLLGVNISAMRSNLVWIERTQTILSQISKAESGVVGDELTVRSYALTGDPRFLQYQKRERTNIAEALAELKRLAASEPGGSGRVAQIRSRVRAHTDVYTSITGFGPDRAAVVAKVINNDAKRNIMFAARRALESYRADELRSLGERQQKLTRQLSQAFLLAIGIIVTAFALGGGGLLLVQFPKRGSRL